MEFQINDTAIYPAHGVGTITDIETMEFEGEELTFYTIKIEDNGMIVKVPMQKAQAIGMRKLMNASDIDAIYDVLRDRDTPPDNQTWNRRYREYMNKIKTGDPLEVAGVVRDLALMKRTKNLSFGERKMYDQAHRLLVQEVALAKQVEEDIATGEIDGIFEADAPKIEIPAED